MPMAVNIDLLSFYIYLLLTERGRNKEEYDKGIDITCYVNPIGMKRAVLQYGLDGVFIKRWERASEAAKCLHIDESSIIKACKRKVLYHKDWLWCYEDENYITETYIAGLKNELPFKLIEVFTKENVLVGRYKSQKDAAEELNVSCSGICNCLRGHIKSTGGYVFKFA